MGKGEETVGGRGEVKEQIIHSDISLQLSVIPGLTRNPVFFWIPASAGMTYSYLINDAV
jgi:hypothetical protein